MFLFGAREENPRPEALGPWALLLLAVFRGVDAEVVLDVAAEVGRR